MAKKLAEHGYPVSAWNRSPERAQALAPHGIAPVLSIADAVHKADVVIACTADLQITHAVFASVDDWHGVTVIELSTGGAEHVKALEAMITGRGGKYLDGAIQCYPYEVGDVDAHFGYSGSPEVWADYEGMLMLFGGASMYISDRVTDASALLLGFSAFYVSALNAFVDAITYLHNRGLPGNALRNGSDGAIALLRRNVPHLIDAIESGNHETTEATIATYLGAAHLINDALHSAGQYSRQVDAAVADLNRAVDAGLGELGFYALTRLTSEPN